MNEELGDEHWKVIDPLRALGEGAFNLSFLSVIGLTPIIGEGTSAGTLSQPESLEDRAESRVVRQLAKIGHQVRLVP
jgi:hypothetical protein